MFTYFVSLLIGSFWFCLVFVKQLISIFKHGIAYLRRPTTTNYPFCVNDPDYGESQLLKIESTVGKKMKKETITIHCKISGSRDNPAMILLHGFPEFWFSWRYQIKKFKKNYRVVAIDLRGYGLSDKPNKVCDYQMKHLVNDVKQVMNELQIQSAIVVGHDWGGALAWAFERECPEMVTKLVVLNIPEPKAFATVLKTSWEQFHCSWYMFYFQLPYLPEWTLSRMDNEFIVSAFDSNHMGMQKTKLSLDEMNSFKANMCFEGSLTGAINYYRAAIQYPSAGGKKASKRSDDANRYLLIFGDKDGAITLQCVKESKKILPNLNVKILDGISHWVQQDDPDEVNKLIEKFIK